MKDIIKELAQLTIKLERVGMRREATTLRSIVRELKDMDEIPNDMPFF